MIHEWHYNYIFTKDFKKKKKKRGRKKEKCTIDGSGSYLVCGYNGDLQPISVMKHVISIQK
jgi:hypothetical protein